MSKSPKPGQIRELRETYGLSQSAAAEIAYSTLRTWQNWEAGTVSMHPAIWAWFKHVVTRGDRERSADGAPEEAPSVPAKYVRQDIQFWWRPSDQSIHVTAPHGTKPKLHTTFKDDPDSDRYHRSMFSWLARMLETHGKPGPKEGT
jgi:hypothetical protein